MRVFVIHFGDAFPHRLPLKFEAVSAVNDAVEDGISEGWFADDVMPSLDG